MGLRDKRGRDMRLLKPNSARVTELFKQLILKQTKDLSNKKLRPKSHRHTS